MAWTIYCHIHIETGRRYVGLTARTWQRRWAQHLSQSGRLSRKGWSHFANAIRLYGKDAFSHEVLEVCETPEAANAAEERWIEQLGTRDPEMGFNLMRGGQHTPHPVRNPWDRPEFRANHPKDMSGCRTPEARAKNKASLQSPEVRAKLSDIARAKHLDPGYRSRNVDGIRKSMALPERRQKVSDLVRGRTRATTSDEARENLSAALIGRKLSPEHIARLTGRKLSPEHVAKTRHRPPKKDFCIRGHDMANARPRSGGYRYCRECANERQRVRRSERA